MSREKLKRETYHVLVDAQWSVDCAQVDVETAIDADDAAYARRRLKAALRRLHHAQRAYAAMR